MAKIENPKNYTGRDLETIFFRPMLSGSDAVDLGIVKRNFEEAANEAGADWRWE